jgi:hypothetical protein
MWNDGTSDNQALGKGENLTGETFILFNAYFGAPTFNDDYVSAVRSSTFRKSRTETVAQ